MRAAGVAEGGRVSVNSFRSRLLLFAGLSAVWAINALALFGDAVAGNLAIGLEAVAATGAMGCGLVIAARKTGRQRLWRLLIVAGVLSWLIGELIWWSHGGVAGVDVAPPLAIGAYFAFLVFALGALLVLAQAGRGVTGRWDGPLRFYLVTAGLDALVAALAFVIFIGIAEVGAQPTDSLPRTHRPTVAIPYALIELSVVVVAVVLAMVYRAHRPYRANCLLLAGGVVAIAASDRLIAYLHSVGFEDWDLWVGSGFVLGPLLIAYAVLDLPVQIADARAFTYRAMDWAQLILPYAGFFGTVLLFAFHVVVGRQLSPIVVITGVVMLSLVAARQVIAIRAQWLLTYQLYETQRRLAHQVGHDPLTGLPNRLLFARRLEAAMAHGQFVLIFIDLDDFKEVNDKFGHAAGDELLCAVGERLKRCVGEDDTLARFGGDEFAVLVDGSTESPEVVADRLRVALREPFAVQGSAVRVRASMGLVRPNAAGEPALTSDDLLRQADISMYAGKRLGKDTTVVYRPSSGAATDFPTALRQAGGDVPAGFSLVYQPIVRLADGETVAIEALARWTAPSGLQIPPETFVAAAEAAGLGAALDTLVLDLACREVRAAGSSCVVHVNVGAGRLGNSALDEQVRRVLDRYAMPEEQLVIEITETVPIVDLKVAAADIRRLGDLGVKVALDDFGAGYNSLTYLHALPVQIIKLDRGLAVTADPERDVTLYRSVIGLCEALGLEVIAEGIESQAQIDTVRAAGCRLGQGHLLGRPAPLSELISAAAPES
jgi:diguanylate cyclase (GGDEF)-like protein